MSDFISNDVQFVKNVDKMTIPNNININNFRPQRLFDLPQTNLNNVTIIQRPTSAQMEELINSNQQINNKLEQANMQIINMQNTIDTLNDDLNKERKSNTKLTKKIAYKNYIIGIMSIITALFIFLCTLLITKF
jgi:hypothetical protein